MKGREREGKKQGKREGKKGRREKDKRREGLKLDFLPGKKIKFSFYIIVHKIHKKILLQCTNFA